MDTSHSFTNTVDNTVRKWIIFSSIVLSLYFGWEVGDQTGQVRSSDLFGLNNITRLIFFFSITIMLIAYYYNYSGSFLRIISKKWLLVYFIALISILAVSWPDLGSNQVKSSYGSFEWILFVAFAGFLCHAFLLYNREDLFQGAALFLSMTSLLTSLNIFLIAIIYPRVAYFPEAQWSLGGFLLHPNRLSILCAIGIASIFYSNSIVRKILFSAFLLIIAAMTGSRSGTLLSLFAFICGFSFQFGKISRYYLYALSGLALILIIYYLFSTGSSSINVRVNARELNDLNGRDAVWQAAKFMILEKPIFGWGWYEGPSRIGEFVGQRWWFARNAQNDILNFAVASGIVNAMIVLYIYVKCLVAGLSSVSQDGKVYIFTVVFVIFCSSLVEPVASSLSNIVGITLILFTTLIDFQQVDRRTSR